MSPLWHSWAVSKRSARATRACPSLRRAAPRAVARILRVFRAAPDGSQFLSHLCDRVQIDTAIKRPCDPKMDAFDSIPESDAHMQSRLAMGDTRPRLTRAEVNTSLPRASPIMGIPKSSLPLSFLTADGGRGPGCGSGGGRSGGRGRGRARGGRGRGRGRGVSGRRHPSESQEGGHDGADRERARSSGTFATSDGSLTFLCLT